MNIQSNLGLNFFKIYNCRKVKKEFKYLRKTYRHENQEKLYLNGQRYGRTILSKYIKRHKWI